VPARASGQATCLPRASDRLALVYTAPPSHRHYNRFSCTLHQSGSRQHRESTPKTFTPPPQQVSDACAELLHITRYSPNQVAIAAPSSSVRNSSNYLGSFGVGHASSLCRTAARRNMRAFGTAPPQHPRSPQLTPLSCAAVANSTEVRRTPPSLHLHGRADAAAQFWRAQHALPRDLAHRQPA
jgi:hypothetical protein